MTAPINVTRTYSDIRRDMTDYMPRYYGGSVIVGNVLDREATELSGLNTDVADVLAQFFIDSSTWGLANWERVCGITTDVTKPIEQRRSVIRSKLRGVGTVTVALIKNVAEAYDNGAVSVTENNAAYAIDIKFISVGGIPANLADIQAALREIIPAHIGITFLFTYMTWTALDAKAFTWDSLTTHNYTWNQYEALV